MLLRESDNEDPTSYAKYNLYWKFSNYVQNYKSYLLK
jgi:hypothetical protein